MSKLDLSLNPQDRQELSTAIEKLIGLLDELDPDWDMEPELGAAENHPDGYRGEASQSEWYAPQDHSDREEDSDFEPWLGGAGHWTDAGLQYDLEEDKGDCEPTFGWTNRMDQSKLEVCAATDECEPTGDDEPLLGWSERCGQGPVVGVNATMGDISFDCEGAGGGGLDFDKSGYREARSMVIQLRHRLAAR